MKLLHVAALAAAILVAAGQSEAEFPEFVSGNGDLEETNGEATEGNEAEGDFREENEDEEEIEENEGNENVGVASGVEGRTRSASSNLATAQHLGSSLNSLLGFGQSGVGHFLGAIGNPNFGTPLGSGIGGSQFSSGFGVRPTGSGFGGRPAGSAFGGNQFTSGFGGRPTGSGFGGNQFTSGFGGRPAGSGFGGRPFGSSFGGRPGLGGRPFSSGFGGRPFSQGFGGSTFGSGFGSSPASLGFGGFGGGCRYSCRVPGGRYVCCKIGQCPAIRPSCPVARQLPPSPCVNDFQCAGSDKCCYDTCLEEHVCKPVSSAVGFGR